MLAINEYLFIIPLLQQIQEELCHGMDSNDLFWVINCEGCNYHITC